MATPPAPVDPQRSRWDATFTIFSALEKMLIVIGVPIAAYWTYFTFSSNDSQKARLRYETELARAKSFGVQADIDARPIVIGKRRYIAGVVTVRNIGAQMIAIDKHDPQIVTIGRAVTDPVSARQAADVVVAPIIENSVDARRFAGISPQRSIGFPFAARVAGPGLYVVQFRAPLSFLEDGRATRPLVWGNKALVTVV